MLISRCIKRKSAAALLLGLRPRIPTKYGCPYLVNVVCCQVEVHAASRFLVQKSPTEGFVYAIESGQLQKCPSTVQCT
jgi:hypothetical protein